MLELEQLMPVLRPGRDELNLAFNFMFLHAEFEAEPLRTIVEAIEAQLPEASWPVYTGSNHDTGRVATRWAGGDPAKARVALLMLLTLRGTPFLYYGDEIGHARRAARPSGRARPGGTAHGRSRAQPRPLPDAHAVGRRARRRLHHRRGRAVAAARRHRRHNVAAQRDDPDSTLHFTRDAIALRRSEADLTRGPYASVPAPDGVWAFRRGDGYVVGLNLSGAEASVEGVDGTIAIATDRGREGEAVSGALTLPPWQGAVVKL